MSVERRFSRREFLSSIFATAFLAACTGSIPQNEQSQKEIESNVPQMGDIIVGKNAQLLRGGMRFDVRDLETYMRRSGNPGKVYRLGENEAEQLLSQYPKGRVEPYQFAIAQGDLKRFNLDGGKKLIYAQGFLSSDRRPYAQIIPRKDAFTSLRNRLKIDGWDPDSPELQLKDILFLDSYIFSYNENELKTYGIGDTLRDPKINNGLALRFAKKIYEQNPFDQADGFGHSLGGLYILQMAMQYPDLFNNLVFINAPIMGLNLNILQNAGIQVLKAALSSYGIDPTIVVDYLSGLWNDDYHKKLKRFFIDFTKRGGKVLIVDTQGDVFVTRESTGIDEFKGISGVETLVINAGNVNPFNAVDIFNAHGIALFDENVLNKSRTMVGKNRWNV